MTESSIGQFINAVATGEVVKQTPVAEEEEQRTLMQLGEEKTRAPKADIPYEDMTSYQIYELLLEGKLPPSAVRIYFQKQRDEEIALATGALYKRSHPINSVERQLWEHIREQHAKTLAEDYSDPQQIASEVRKIEARYEPLIKGTPQDHTRYFANQAISISLHNASIKRERSVEEINRSNTMVANLYGLASRLSREVVVEKVTPAGKSPAVVTDSKPIVRPTT